MYGQEIHFLKEVWITKIFAVRGDDEGNTFHSKTR